MRQGKALTNWIMRSDSVGKGERSGSSAGMFEEQAEKYVRKWKAGRKDRQERSQGGEEGSQGRSPGKQQTLDLHIPHVPQISQHDASVISIQSPLRASHARQQS